MSDTSDEFPSLAELGNLVYNLESNPSIGTGPVAELVALALFSRDVEALATLSEVLEKPASIGRANGWPEARCLKFVVDHSLSLLSERAT